MRKAGRLAVIGGYADAVADDTRAPFQRVVDAVRADIATGRLKPGDRLPSVRKLADRYGVAQMTVQNALRSLTGQGVVGTVPSAYSYVTEQAPSIVGPVGKLPDGAAADLLTTLAEDLAAVRARVENLETRVRQVESRTPDARGDG